MTDYFEQDKVDRLKRLRALRIFYGIGAVNFRRIGSGYAEPTFRFWHPAVWLYLLAALVVGTALEGVPAIIRDIKSVPLVWW